jgi:hypothetical protein
MFIYLLFTNVTVSNSKYIVLNNWMLVNNELEKLYQEALVTYLKVVTQHCCGGTEESNEDSVSVASVSIDV